jgi:hypothetical protein
MEGSHITGIPIEDLIPMSTEELALRLTAIRSFCKASLLKEERCPSKDSDGRIISLLRDIVSLTGEEGDITTPSWLPEDVEPIPF